MPGRLIVVFVVAALILCLARTRAGAGESPESRRAAAAQKMRDGNYRDAAATFRELALADGASPKTAAADFENAVSCHQRLNEQELIETLFESIGERWKKSWRVLYALADMRLNLPPVSVRLVQPGRPGLVRRLPAPAGGGEAARVSAIGVMLQAERHLDSPDDPATPSEKLDFHAFFADAVARGREGRLAWRFTSLTDPDRLPDPEDDAELYSIPRRNAPVDADGNPLYYRIPDSWDAAANDGERWRWLLSRMEASGDPAAPGQADIRLGRFLLDQFGVQTMTAEAPLSRDADVGGKTGPFAVRTLTEDETIARLANGLKRFRLPDECNHIKVLRRAADRGGNAPDDGVRRESLALLAHIFENRQQYDRAVLFWSRLDGGGAAKDGAADAIRRITGNNGLLEPGPVAPAGSVTSLSYLFRNGDRVRMTAKRLDEKKLLRDIRDRIASRSGELYGNFAMRRPEMLGRAVVMENMNRYVAETVAEWDVDLTPLPDYFSSRTNIDLPFAGAGCYLVEAAMRDGNVSRAVLWIADLALVRKTLGDGQLHFVADAVTGEPVPKANLTFMGFRAEYDPDRDRTDVFGDVFAERADDDGLCVVDAARLADREWLIAAETDDGRLAYLGFDHFWAVPDDQLRDERESAFIITDRPVYRPGQEIRFKFWLARPGYSPGAGAIAGRSVRVLVHNPRGEAVYDKTLSTDNYGGADDAIVLGGDAILGAYSLQLDDGPGYASFRIEEYKKPEYEVVLDAPGEAVRLGDRARITVRANYYHGAPVQDAKVVYRIVRTRFDQAWTPPWRWDWLYGAGAWARQYDYSRYPGSSGWNAAVPRPPWMPIPFEQPELVAEGEGRIDADGVFRIDLDTMPAKALFGDSDHSYQITAEVTDKSRRTIVGSGKVVASGKPFAVAVWTSRGYFHAGQDVVAEFRAMLPLGGGVAATGTATLYRIRYDGAGVPSETVSMSASIRTDADGSASWRFAAGDAGQYRLACRLEDGGGNAAESSALLTVRGKPGEGDFRFAALEVVPDKREYRPGETARLAIHSENKTGLVLFFPRAERGSGRPVLIRLENGCATADIPVGAGDQPNFFCEAVTVCKGKVYVETREIFVPPADRTLNIEVTPDKPSYAPGTKASFAVRVTDADGAPVAGQCVVSLYDKAVEYISGGSNVGDIREHFWSRRRHYASSVADSLSKQPYAAERHDDVRWEPIGVFGSQEADWNADAAPVNGVPRGAMAAGYGGGARMLRMQAAPLSAAAPAPMMMEAAVMADEALDAGAAPLAGGGDMAEAIVRSEFADAALWIAALETDAAGNASFSLDMPENLTAWKARVWTMADGVRVGGGEREVETKKNIVIRPQTPRFLTQTDQVVLSANLHNYLPRDKSARAELVLEGGVLELAGGQDASRRVDLAAGGEARVDWIADARRPGRARVVMKLLTDEESDAAETTIPIIVHGARRVEGFGGVLRGEEGEATIAFAVPRERLADQSKLEISFSPGIAASMLDALPFLIEYPYGCTEQTVNRFLPAVMARQFLAGMGVDLAAAKKRLENAPADSRSEAWKAKWGDPRSERRNSPVFDDAELDRMIKAGVERLTSMQNADGGWGWFPVAGEQSWPHTTAVVVHGLLAARDNGAAIPSGIVDDGVNWLRAHQREQIARLKIDPETEDENLRGRRKSRADNTDAFIYMILAKDGRRTPDPDMRDFLYRDRLGLSASGLAMFGIALHHEKATVALAMTLQNLRQFLRADSENGTVWLDVPADGWWLWHNDGIETQAWCLHLLSLVDPHGDAASGLAKYLVQNRKNGTYWRSTRDTAYAIEALTRYAAASGENEPDCVVTLSLDGRPVMERALSWETMLDDNRFTLEGLAVGEGPHELRLSRSGRGSVYFGGALDLFSLEDPIRAAGADLKIDRTFFRLVPEEAVVDRPSSSGVAAAGRVEKFRREEIRSTESREGAVAPLRPGDLVEVELTVTAKNDYEYLVFEDMKAAGLEAVELQSGQTANRLGAYAEYRDQKIALFVRHLPKGTHTVSYRFRAEIPGWYSALPAFGGGMYATDLFANSDEAKIGVGEAGVYGE